MGLSIGARGINIVLAGSFANAHRLQAGATERLATGQRINRASDDPAGLIAAEQLRGDLVENEARVSALSAQRRQNSIQQSGRQVAVDVLRDVQGLLVEASDGSISPEQLGAIQTQIDASLEALDYLGSLTGFALPAAVEALRTGGAASAVDGDAAEGARVLQEQISSMNLARAAAGAYEKYTVDVELRLAEAQNIATASALSQVADADYARESSNLIRGQILTEVAIKTTAISEQSRGRMIASLLDVL